MQVREDRTDAGQRRQDGCRSEMTGRMQVREDRTDVGQRRQDGCRSEQMQAVLCSGSSLEFSEFRIRNSGTKKEAGYDGYVMLRSRFIPVKDKKKS